MIQGSVSPLFAHWNFKINGRNIPTVGPVSRFKINALIFAMKPSEHGRDVSNSFFFYIRVSSSASFLK